MLRAQVSAPRVSPLEQQNSIVWAMVLAVACISQIAWENVAVVLVLSQPMFRGSAATPRHVLHASTQAEYPSPTENAAMASLWCVQ
jgi:hypothetical protein